MASGSRDETLFPRVPIPIAKSILWQPIAGPAAGAEEGYPIFVAEPALTAVHDRLRAASGDGVVGFLIGNIVECPETNVRYIVIHATSPVPERVENDDSLRLVTGTLPAEQQLARQGGARVLGWYHSHPGQGDSLTPGDVATQLRYFPERWHTALVIAAHGDGFAGGFFRVAGDDVWPGACVPFYELLGPEQPGNGGRRRPLLLWSNYRSEGPARGPGDPQSGAPRASADAPKKRTSGAAAGPRVFIPPQAFGAEALPARQPDRLRRPVRLVGFGIGLIAVAYGLWRVLRAPQAPTVPARPLVASAPAPTGPAGLADTLERALDAYRTRAGLFENQQMTCADLASGLITVDAQWLRYSMALRAEPQAIDSSKDAALAARVAGVERQFDGSRCPRP